MCRCSDPARHKGGRYSSRLIAACLMIVISAVGSPAVATSVAANEGQSPAYVPSETSVAILPFVDLTGEDLEEVLNDIEMADRVVATLLLERGFPVVSDEQVLAAMSELALPVHDRAERTPGNLAALADRLRVRLVISGLVVDKRSSVNASLVAGLGGLLSHAASAKQATAAVEIQVWDNLEATSPEDHSGSAWASPPDLSLGGRSAPMRERALRTATAETIERFVKAYPVVEPSVDVSQRAAYRKAMAEALAVPRVDWVPHDTLVLLLPFVDELPDQNDISAELARIAGEHAAHEYRTCGFEVRVGEATAPAIPDEGALSAVPGPPSRAAVEAAGERAGADLVVTGSVLLSVPSMAGGHGLWGHRPFWMVKAEIRVFDMSKDDYVLVATGSAVNDPIRFAQMTTIRNRAAGDAVSNVLRELLLPYQK